MLDFFSEGGEMGERIRAFDWASTSVGAPETWPQSLRLTVRLMLNSRHPMFIWWGEDLVQFYNDGYRRTMGPEMHPAALGAKGRDCWADIWDIIGPQIDHVTAGKGSTWHEHQMVPIKRHGKVDEVWWTYGYSPIDLEGSVGGVLVVCTEVTEQHLLTEKFKARSRRMAQQFESAPGFIAVMRGADHVFELTNAAYRRLIGGRDVIGKPVREALPEVAERGFIQLLDEVFLTRSPHIGRRTPITLRDPESGSRKSLFLDFVYQPILERNGEVSGIFVEGQDVTDHVNGEKKLALMNSELQHRVKNMLALVSAIANQTLSDAAGPEAMGAFQARLRAFSAAHDAMAGAADVVGDLADVLKCVLDPHLPHDDRMTLNGPSVIVGRKQGIALCLALHELATNASKYGALSNESGIVRIEWSAEPGPEGLFRMTWRESGGPRVEPPTRTGFGSRLVRTLLAAELGGEVEVEFPPDGLLVSVVAPRSELASGTTADSAFVHAAVPAHQGSST